MVTKFIQLNSGWNAEPNAPEPRVNVEGDAVVLAFFANPFQFPEFTVGQLLRLRFPGATRYRLGAPNDEGGYRGQCRFSGLAPAWGELYEISGDLKLDQVSDWVKAPVLQASEQRHLFALSMNAWADLQPRVC